MREKETSVLPESLYETYHDLVEGFRDLLFSNLYAEKLLRTSGVEKDYKLMKKKETSVLRKGFTQQKTIKLIIFTQEYIVPALQVYKHITDKDYKSGRSKKWEKFSSLSEEYFQGVKNIGKKYQHIKEQRRDLDVDASLAMKIMKIILGYFDKENLFGNTVYKAKIIKRTGYDPLYMSEKFQDTFSEKVKISQLYKLSLLLEWYIEPVVGILGTNSRDLHQDIKWFHDTVMKYTNIPEYKGKRKLLKEKWLDNQEGSDLDWGVEKKSWNVEKYEPIDDEPIDDEPIDDEPIDDEPIDDGTKPKRKPNKKRRKSIDKNAFFHTLQYKLSNTSTISEEDVKTWCDYLDTSLGSLSVETYEKTTLDAIIAKFTTLRGSPLAEQKTYFEEYFEQFKSSIQNANIWGLYDFFKYVSR